jgi:hypothetical protein
MAAISAPRSQRARISARVTSPFGLDRPQAVDPSPQRAPRSDRPQRPQQRRQAPGPVDPLGRALGDVIVGAEQRRHLGRVRRAAGVLEQQGVEQPRLPRLVQLEHPREAHPDLAGAYRVPRPLAFGDVQRV